MKKLTFIIIALIFIGCKDASEAEYYKIKNDYHAASNKANAQLYKAVTEEEKMAIRKNWPDSDAYIKNVYRLVTNNAESNYAADAWSELFNSTWFKKNDSIFETTIDMLINRHTKDEHLASIYPMFLAKNSDSKTGDFIKKVLNENPSQKVKGIFTLALAQKYTWDKESKSYNLQKGLELFNNLKEDYAAIEIEYGGEKILTKLETIAENSIYSLTAMAIGNKMPEVKSKDLNGKDVFLSDYAGNVIVLDVWATWCGPCIQMIPHQVKMVEHLKDKPFQLISISLDEEASVIHKFQQKTKMPWVNWHNGKTGGVIDDWNIIQYPTILILDKEGIIRHRSNGAVNDVELETIVNALLDSY